jgi:hypothetical protein
VTAITNFASSLDNAWVGYRQNGELAVISSTLTTTFSRFLISPFLLVLLLSVASTVANAQATGQATSVKPQPKADARTPSTGSELSSQQTVRTGATRDNGSGSKSRAVPGNDPNKSAGVADIEVPHGSFRLDTGSHVKRPYRVKTPYGSIDVRG